MVRVTCPLPFQGRFAIRGLALVTINLSTKFEVSNSTQYEDMKGDTKCQKWGGLGYLWSLKVTGNSTNRQSTYEFLLVFRSYYVPILHLF